MSAVGLLVMAKAPGFVGSYWTKPYELLTQIAMGLRTNSGNNLHPMSYIMSAGARTARAWMNMARQVGQL